MVHILRSLPFLTQAGKLMGYFLFGLTVFPLCLASEVTLAQCLPASSRIVPQPFTLPNLKIQWDSWGTSQLATAVAAIILNEKLGFNVSLVTDYNAKTMYAGFAAGDIHLGFEAWPASNAEEFKEYVGPIDSVCWGFKLHACLWSVCSSCRVLHLPSTWYACVCYVYSYMCAYMHAYMHVYLYVQIHIHTIRPSAYPSKRGGSVPFRTPPCLAAPGFSRHAAVQNLPMMVFSRVWTKPCELRRRS